MKKQTKVLGGLFIVCMMIWLGQLSMEQITSTKKEKTYGFISDNSVTKIILKEKNEEIEIQKNNLNRWEIDGVEADQNKIRSILSDVQLFKNKRLISENPEKYHVYEVETDNITVTLRDNTKELLSFTRGKQGPTWDSTYIKFKSDRNVYVINEALSFQYQIDRTFWKDLSVLTIHTQDISQIKLTDSSSINKTISLSKRENEWINEEKKSTENNDILTSLLNQLTNLKATDVIAKEVDKLQELGLNKPAIRLSIKTINNRDIQLDFGKKIEELVNLTISEKPNVVYQVQSSLLDSIREEGNKLFK